MNKKNIVVLSDEELRSLQKKGLEIFSYIIKALTAMNLTYYCVGGTAIGAVKYKGFVPWDDDIDIAMPRDDYMKFLLEGHKYLPSHLYISSCFTEKKYFGSVAKVRDIGTSYFDVPTAKFNICHGAFVDVFPIDGYLRSTKIEQLVKKINLGKIAFMQDLNLSLFAKLKAFLCFLFCLFKPLNRCALTVEKILMKNRIADSELIYNRIMIFRKEIFGSPIKGVFEGIQVNLPERIDDYLMQCFGDISKDIPENKKFPHHFAYLVDLSTSYTNYSYVGKGRFKRC